MLPRTAIKNYLTIGAMPSQILAVVALVAFSCVANARILDVEDVLRAQRLQEVQISTTLELVAVTVSRPAAIGDNFRAQPHAERFFVPLRSNLKVISTVDGQVVFSVDGYADASTAFAPRWSPDGKKLAFLRGNRAGQLSLSIWDAETESETVLAPKNVRGAVPLVLSGRPDEARRSFHWLSSNGSFAWLSDNEIVLTLAAEEVLTPTASHERAVAASDEGQLSVRVWNTQRIAACQENDVLAVVSVDDGELTTVARGDFIGVSISPNGKAMVVVTVANYPSPPRDQPLRIPPRLYWSPTSYTPYIEWRSEVLVREGGQWVGKGKSVSGKGAVLNETLPRWSPRGDKWAVMSLDDPFAAEPSAELVELGLDGNILERTEYRYRTEAMAELARFQVADPGPVVESPLDGNDAVAVGHTVSGANVAHASRNGVTTLWASKGTKTIQLLELNGHLHDVAHPEPIPVSYQANGGTRTGWLIMPSEATGRVPVTMYAYPRSFPTTASVMRPEGSTPILHTLLAKGVAIFIADFRIEPVGKVPPEQEPVDRITTEIGAAVEALKKNERLDTERIAFYGHSFGAYTALTLLSTTNYFRAIVASAPIGDLVAHAFEGDRLFNQKCGPAQMLVSQMLHEDPGLSESGAYGDEAQTMIMRMGMPPYLDFDKYVRNSPLFNLASATTPTLIIQGEEDGFSDGERVFNTLYRLGVESTLLYYWGEGHVIGGPENVRDMTKRTAEWIMGHLKSPPSDDSALPVLDN